MNSFSKPIEDHNILFEQFLGDNNSEVELEYDETLLEQLINQNSILLDAENIESNKQSNIFTLKIFMGTWQINTSIVAKFLDGKVNLGVCFEINGRHIYQKNGSEKSKFNCENDGLHDEDSDKILVVLANWLLLVVKNESKNRKEIILIYDILNPALHFFQN
ncbi:hypothetical protein GLOIN_2v1779232 [Rhizophagus irregularis DAOM 181602=DAOM 197198]|nr:hypothetical protein GLOIN_2v1779232 [Rhizophagus irregularis DAOM 181602=DAOM 197198]